jgi:hypothetical protein
MPSKIYIKICLSQRFKQLNIYTINLITYDIEIKVYFWIILRNKKLLKKVLSSFINI